MRPLIHTISRWLMVIAEPRKLLSWIYLPRYVKHWHQYQAKSDKQLRLKDSHPCLSDWLPSTPYDPHYFFQGAWLARRLAAIKPAQHVDIGSSVLTLSVLSAHVPTVFVDYRPLNVDISNLQCVAGNIVSLPFATASLQSLSCMHVLEHIGLGRYGDPIDPEGSRKAAAELARVLSPGGRLYLTVPVGRSRVCFNAHRVFAPQAISRLFPGLRLSGFSWVNDAGHLHASGQPEDAAASEYGCGLYEFVGNLNV